MTIHLTDVVPMSAHQVLIGFRWKPCCKALLTLVIGVSLSAWAQPRLAPTPDQIVLPASVHAPNNQAGSLRAVEREWRKNRNDLPASLARHPVPDGVQAIEVDATDAASVATAFARLDDGRG